MSGQTPEERLLDAIFAALDKMPKEEKDARIAKWKEILKESTDGKETQAEA